MTNLNYLIYAIVGFIIVFGLIYIFVKKYTKSKIEFKPDNMEGHEFEEYCAGLMEINGFTDVVVTKESGDYGVDVLATKDMVTYAVQCKVYQSPVGIKAIQEAYSGRDYYDRMVGVVMTNQYFTKPAIEAAAKLKILLWDRDHITEMIKNADVSR